LVAAALQSIPTSSIVSATGTFAAVASIAVAAGALLASSTALTSSAILLNSAVTLLAAQGALAVTLIELAQIRALIGSQGVVKAFGSLTLRIAAPPFGATGSLVVAIDIAALLQRGRVFLSDALAAMVTTGDQPASAPAAIGDAAAAGLVLSDAQ
jgi:hypothetical protein